MTLSCSIPTCRSTLSLVCLCALLILTTAALGAPFGLQLSEYHKQAWQVEDGLPENNVRMIAQRADGRLLLATSSGLSTFDGLRFQNLPIPGSPDGEAVNAFLETDDGVLWIGTDGRGVLERTPYGSMRNISELAGRENERVRNLYKDRSGALWIATQNGIERYQSGKLQAYPEAGMISGDITTPFAEDGRGGLFFITSKGLYHLADGKCAPFRLRTATAGRPVAVYRDPQQRLWLGTMNGVLQLVLRHDGRYDEVRYTPVSSPVTVLRGDAQGNLWIGTLHGGIRRLNEHGLDSWTSKDGLPDDAICSLFVDNAQNLWIGTQTGGLSRWRKGAFATYAQAEGFPSTTAATTFFDSHGDLWLGTWGAGLFRLHHGKLEQAKPPGLQTMIPIRALAESKLGQLWIGTWFDGVYRYDGHAYRHYLLGTESPGNAVSSILVDHNGGLWIGTYIGLLYFPSGEPQAARSQYLESLLITCLLEDSDGSILAGTSTGMFRIRDGHAEPIAALPHPYVLSITRDSRGGTWVGTKAGGLALLEDNHVLPVDARSGLPMLPVHTAVEDGDGHLWLGTIHGILRVNVDSLHDVAKGRSASLSPIFFGREDGMRSSEIVGTSQPASARTADGALWFVTAKGFVHTTDVAENIVHSDPISPTLGWTLSDDMDPAHAQAGGPIVMGPAQPDLTFFFNVVELSNPSQIEFRYRLFGYDADWITTRGRSARYRRLPPGNYHFEVQARRSGDAWWPVMPALAVAQKNHFYQTWYFYTALLLLVAGIAVQIFRQRVKLVKGRLGILVEERSRIARECHDTLMAGFAAISWQLEATAKLFTDNGLTETPAARSCALARSMVAHCQAEARRIIWDLRDTEELADLLSHALSRTISATGPSDAVEISFRVEGKEMPLAPADVHHLVCIGQEAVSNALRHAEPSHIAVRLRYEADALHLTVRDDGCGFRGGVAKAGHFGIAVMEERARKVGGVLRVQSARDAGTEVSVSVAFSSPAKKGSAATHQDSRHESQHGSTSRVGT